MLNISYNYYQFAEVVSLADFYNSPGPDTKKVHSMMDIVKLMFSLPSNRIVLHVAEEGGFYKITMLGKDVNHYPFGWFVYIPSQKRLDLYSADEPAVPLIQWKNRKAVFKSIPSVMDAAGAEKIFERLVNLI